MRPTIYFVRHGETDWNVARRIQGHTDIPLNDTGRAQARRNGSALKTVVREAAAFTFVSSPLGRAQETMRIVRTELGLPPATFAQDERLKELNFGQLEGLPWIGDQLARDPSLYPERACDPFAWRPLNGESYADLTKRLDAWIVTLTGPVIAVSHGGVMRALRGLVRGLPRNDIPTLDTPQDKVLVLEGTTERWL
jgi:probable phosphoglycerate mutase